MHTIDPKMLMAWGDVLAFGASKYHQRNFMVAPGMEWSRVYDSLLRHLLQFWGGEWLDEESGLPHLAHVLCNLQFLWTYHEHPQYRIGDDRPSSIEYDDGSWKDWRGEFEEAQKSRVEDRPGPNPQGECVVPFEVELNTAMATLERLGFKGKVIPHGEYEGQTVITNELGETPQQVLAQHGAVKDPAFMRDPLRSYYANQNKGSHQ